VKRSIIIVLFIVSAFINKELAAQINNYWSMGSNTSSSLLGGAVVGGGAGDVAIFYNPAAIEVVAQKQIAFNASVLNFNFYKYKNALGPGESLDYLEWAVKPRFLSYQFKIKSNPKLSCQVTLFSRNEQLTELWDFQKFDVTNIPTGEEFEYTASYDLNRRYTDYWLGAGASYNFSSKFSVGMTLFGSAKSLRYFQSSVIDLVPTNNSISKNQSWSSIERQYFYVISIIPKIGFLYKSGQIGYGLNITIPSMRLWGDGYSKRLLQYSNITYDNQLKDDYLRSEYNNYIVANIKEPLAISFGVTFHSKNNRSNLFLTTEYFAPVKTYKVLDNTRISGWGQSEFQPGTDFLSYRYGAKEVINFAVGFRHILNERLSILSGIKTNFSSYDPSSAGEWAEIKDYVTMTPSLYHISLGAQFKIKGNTIILGTEYSYGVKNNEMQMANYGYPGIFDEEKRIALQYNTVEMMNFSTQAIGFYLGYSLDF
jgi:hypothetical protein